MFCSLTLSAPHGVPASRTLQLWSLPHSSRLPFLLFLVFPSLFALYFGKFLLTSIQIHWFFPQPCPVHWWAHQRHPLFLSLVSISSISFWFFLRGSISLPKLPICSCMVPTFSIRTLNILTSYFKFLVRGTSLVVQWLRIHLPMQGTWVQSLVKRLRSHMPWGGKARMLQRRAHRTQPRPRKNEDLVQPKVNRSTDKFPVW